MLSQKELVTEKEIKQDVIHYAMNPQEDSETGYKKWMFAADVALVGLFLLTWYFIEAVLWLFVAVLILLIVVAFGLTPYLILKERFKNRSFRIEDYEVTVEALSHKHEEKYEELRVYYGTRIPHHETVSYYELFFENGGKWHVPEQLYRWSVERRTNEHWLFENAHRGDRYIVVRKKDSDEVFVAYPTEYFEYKNVQTPKYRQIQPGEGENRP